MKLLTTICSISLAADACQGNRSVVGRVVSVSFLCSGVTLACFQSSGT